MKYSLQFPITYSTLSSSHAPSAAHQWKLDILGGPYVMKKQEEHDQQRLRYVAMALFEAFSYSAATSALYNYLCPGIICTTSSVIRCTISNSIHFTYRTIYDLLSKKICPIFLSTEKFPGAYICGYETLETESNNECTPLFPTGLQVFICLLTWRIAVWATQEFVVSFNQRNQSVLNSLPPPLKRSLSNLSTHSAPNSPAIDGDNIPATKLHRTYSALTADARGWRRCCSNLPNYLDSYKFEIPLNPAKLVAASTLSLLATYLWNPPILPTAITIIGASISNVMIKNGLHSIKKQSQKNYLRYNYIIQPIINSCCCCRKMDDTEA